MSLVHAACPRNWKVRAGRPDVPMVRLSKEDLREINEAFSAREQRMALAPSTLVITRRVKQ